MTFGGGELPDVVVEAGFAVGAAVGDYLLLDDPARGLLDTAAVAPDEIWTDITAWVGDLSTRRLSSRATGPLVRYDAGTATVRLDGSDRRFDPTNLAGPYVSAGRTLVDPMRAVRVRATWAGVTYEVWRGFADSWRTTYPSPGTAETVLTCTDAFKVLANFDRPAGGAVGAGEDTGARVIRILDSAGWPVEDRLIDAGSSTLQATTLDGQALGEAQKAVEAEIGELFVDGGGRVVFRSRHATLTDARSVTPQAVFGPDPGELPYSDVTPDYDDTQLVNKVQAAVGGGAVQTAQDTTSAARYLTRAVSVTDLLLQTDAAAAQWAGFVLYQSKDPEYRFTQLAVNPRTDKTALYPVVLGLRMGDRVTVRLQPAGGGAAIERDVFIRGIEHTAAGMQWRTVFTLGSASKYTFMILDDPVLGALDENALSY